MPGRKSTSRCSASERTRSRASSAPSAAASTWPRNAWRGSMSSAWKTSADSTFSLPLPPSRYTLQRRPSQEISSSNLRSTGTLTGPSSASSRRATTRSARLIQPGSVPSRHSASPRHTPPPRTPIVPSRNGATSERGDRSRTSTAGSGRCQSRDRRDAPRPRPQKRPRIVVPFRTTAPSVFTTLLDDALGRSKNLAERVLVHPEAVSGKALR